MMKTLQWLREQGYNIDTLAHNTFTGEEVLALLDKALTINNNDMNAEEFIDRFVDQYPTNHAELRILLDSFLESQPKQSPVTSETDSLITLINLENARQEPKQLSDEDIITDMFNRAEELELDLYKEEVEELYKVVKTQTGGGVDLLDDENITTHNAEIVGSFMEHCEESGLSIPSKLFESFFNA